MQYQDFERLLSQLPAGTQVTLLNFVLPPGDGKLPSPTAGHGRTLPPARTVPSGADGDRRDWPAPDRSGSVEARLASTKRELGEGALLKPREWRGLVGVPERELERAMECGAIASQKKGYGRDHAALVVSVEAMEGYLATARAVEAGEMDPPAWWEAVRLQGRRLPRKRLDRGATN